MKKINVVAPLNNTGYGVASIGYLNQLCAENPDIAVVPIGNISNQGEISSKVMDCISRNKPDFDAPTFCFWHLFDMKNQLAQFKGPKVGFTTFEVNSLSNNEQEAIVSLDMIGTASTWGTKILAKYIGDKKVFTAPHAFKSTPKQEIPFIKPEDHSKLWRNMLAPATFPKDSLILSTAGKWESRKGHPELLEACIESEHPILLIGFVHNPWLQDNFPYSFINSHFMYPMYTNSGIKFFRKGNLYFVLMPPTASRKELHSALAKANFFISPSKGEGWNLPLFEMMSMGMPCISTIVSAMSDYCDDSSVIKVPTVGLTQAKDDKFFDGTHQWYNVTKDCVREAINLSLDIKDTTKLQEKAVGKTSKFSWQESARTIQTLMNQF